MSELKVLFLDFDGVILESVDIKGWAFGKLFEEDHPEIVDDVRAYHYANGGVPRYDKFRYYYKELLKEPLSDEKFQELCDRFEELVFQRVLACDFVKGALEFLKTYHQELHLFVISGAPHDEIRNVVKHRDLSPYFKDVMGSPTKKGEWTRRLLEQHNFSPEEALWVGDAKSDFKAALENNIRFVARTIEGDDTFEGLNVDYSIDNLEGLDAIVQELLLNTKEIRG